MTPESAARWRRVSALLDRALEQEPGQRASYLRRACAGERELRGEVEALLALASAPSFLDSGALAFAAPLLDPAADRDGDPALSREGAGIAGLLHALADDRQAEAVVPGVPECVASAPGVAYQLERELGRGGMATVYLAHDAKHGRRVAMKVLSEGLATLVGAESFVREIRLTARLQHPHILGLIDSGVFGPEAAALEGRPFYTMPYVEGESLRARLAHDGVLPPAEAVRLLREIVDALCYAHEQGVVHRDIKPENILLSRGHAVVADFGIAKALVESRTEAAERVAGSDAEEPSLTPLGRVVGTPAYMAPEQVAGRPDIDHRADLYAWGMVAYELLAGRHPFGDSGTRHELLEAHRHRTPPPLREVAPAVPPRLAELVMRCLAKDPAERPVSGAEILAALDAAAPESPESAVAASRFAAARGWRLGAMAMLLLLLVLAAGTAARRAIAPAAHAVVVVGTGEPAVDVPAVQAAVDRADTVILEGRFSFDAPPTRPLAPPLASGWFPPAAEVRVWKAVVISGVRGVRGEMTTIQAGTIPLLVDAPGARVVIRGLRFVRPTSHAILVYAARGVEITACTIDGLVPFAAVADGIAINTHGGMPTPANPGDPANVSGRLLIHSNDIDATGGTAHDGTAGIVVFSVGRSPGREVDLDIIGNTVRNATTSTVIVRRVDGRVRVLGNALGTSREIGVWGNDAVRLVNSGAFLMANNTIECRWADCSGIAVFSQFAEWPMERAVVEDNEVIMSPPSDAAFSDSSAGIVVKGFAHGNVIRRNTIRGRAGAALAMYVFRGGVPTENEFIDNRFDHFQAALADIFVGGGVRRRRIIGPGTIADRGAVPAVER